MQIKTTVLKAALLWLGFHLGGGSVVDQKADQASRCAIGDVLGTVPGVRLGVASFALSPADVADHEVTLELTIEQLGRAEHKLRDGQWPAFTDAQLDAVIELTAEVGQWLKAAKARDLFAQLPAEERAKAARGE